MSLLDCISRFRTPGTGVNGTYTVTRTAPGSYVNGERVVGSTSTVLITASVQPLSAGRHTIVLPEGVRTEDVRELWTTFELRVNDANAEPDVIAIPGGLSLPVEAFTVFQVAGPWTMSGRTFYQAWAARRSKP